LHQQAFTFQYRFSRPNGKPPRNTNRNAFGRPETIAQARYARPSRTAKYLERNARPNSTPDT